MVVVDASCLFEVVARTARAPAVGARLAHEEDQAAPHLVDAEVLRVIRMRHLRGDLDGTAASLAVEDLAQWPGERFGHRALLPRGWELRSNVRSWDALYVALAEALRAPLLTMDARLAGAAGVRCAVEVVRRAAPEPS